MTGIKNAQKLIDQCNEAMFKNEHRCSTIKGVKNLSRSDLEQAVLYAETYMQTGGIDSLMTPYGEVKELLNKFGIA